MRNKKTRKNETNKQKRQYLLHFFPSTPEIHRQFPKYLKQFLLLEPPGSHLHATRKEQSKHITINGCSRARDNKMKKRESMAWECHM